VDDEVRAEGNRTLEHGAGKSIVDDQARVMGVRNLGGLRDVGQAQDRVGRRLDEQHLRIGADGPLDHFRLRRIDVAELELVARQHLVEQPERAAVGVVGDDDVVAGLEHGRDGMNGRHA